MIQKVVKWLLISIGSLLLLCFIFYVILVANYPNHREMMEEEYQRAEHDEMCWVDSIGAMTPKEQQLCDSMLKKNFTFFRINRLYYYSECPDVKRKSKEEFWFRHMRKRPVYASLEAKSEEYLMQLTKHVFNNYIANEDIMSYEKFHLRDDFFHVHREISREELFELCGFKVEEVGKGKYKRVVI